ncbi:regenerating islet-derived protein 4-like [Sceloporus undulatus]|uniref:regenerating islet-derived protein 4-like n=1 Tax=Sceloporus undulatus TaxID=8520 RepID=UPI001C4BCF8F|nr:regenerating islet-derived protein 4-like [Sceloporus undulatus]
MGLFAYASLCLFGLLLSSPFPGGEAASCARGWLQNQGNCYAYFDTKMTWSEAEIECQSYGRGAHLASVLSKAESALIAQHISAYQRQKSHVWIGLNDPLQTDKWKWSDESVYNYEAWASGEPNGSNEFCTELNQYTNFREWNDRNCLSRQAYICKYEL